MRCYLRRRSSSQTLTQLNLSRKLFLRRSRIKPSPPLPVFLFNQQDSSLWLFLWEISGLAPFFLPPPLDGSGRLPSCVSVSFSFPAAEKLGVQPSRHTRSSRYQRVTGFSLPIPWSRRCSSMVRPKTPPAQLSVGSPFFSPLRPPLFPRNMLPPISGYAFYATSAFLNAPRAFSLSKCFFVERKSTAKRPNL